MQHYRKPLKEQIKDLFSVHSGERRGALAFVGILVLLFSWVAYAQWFKGPHSVDLTKERMEMERWLAARDSVEAELAKPRELFSFDPNVLERAQWLALGFTDRQVDGIERYLSKGGRFRVKGDLGKMYSLRPGQYEQLEPYIELPDSLPKRASKWEKRKDFGDEREPFPRSTEPYERSERRTFNKVEVNTADSVSLVALPGIGPSFAKGILAYRERLGGFVSLDQLAEVYVLKDKPDALERVSELLVVDTLMVRKIPINTCTVEELAEHPYARWKLAKPLLAYRQQHGPFKQVEDIRGCVLIDEEAFRKLAPYLSVE
jgi:competence protein ComEA